MEKSGIQGAWEDRRLEELQTHIANTISRLGMLGFVSAEVASDVQAPSVTHSPGRAPPMKITANFYIQCHTYTSSKEAGE